MRDPRQQHEPPLFGNREGWATRHSRQVFPQPLQYTTKRSAQLANLESWDCWQHF